MIWFSILALIIGLGLGAIMMQSNQQKKTKRLLEQALGELNEKNESLNQEVMQLKQKLADTSYKLSQTEKDYRYLKQMSEKKEPR